MLDSDFDDDDSEKIQIIILVTAFEGNSDPEQIETEENGILIEIMYICKLFIN
ncbi:hypothetical protein QTP88_010403 [Uroleucon formosanum]